VKALLVTIILSSALVGGLAAATLSVEEQQRIIDNYVAFTLGKDSDGRPLQAALHEADHDHGGYKCGTPAILEFYRNYSSLDPRLVEAAGAALATRPTTEHYYDTPGGRVRIHYDKTGPAQVWQAGVDSDGDGVPDYVETLAGYADRAYAYMTDTLGYPDPVDDSGTPSGGDSRVDIYLISLSANYYGATWPEYVSFPGGTPAVTPSWVVIDHDFQQIPAYVGRPLEAAKVTMAHEMFHTVHFSIDASEKIEWFEMTAVWMEEEQWDDVNDYYYYTPKFFNIPTRSLQSTWDTHHYASAIFPIFLSERYGDDIIRSVWEYSAINYNLTSYLQGCNLAIDSATCGKESYHSAFAEFAVWNFFTGPYAHQAPAGIGYPEAAAYDFFKLESMALHRQYPIYVPANTNQHLPEPNAATYIRMENLQAVTPNASPSWFFFCDTTPGYWGVSAIYQLEQYPDSHVVRTGVAKSVRNIFIDSLVGFWDCDSNATVWDSCLQDSVIVCTDSTFPPIDVSRYRSVTLVLSPTITDANYFATHPDVAMAYSLAEPSSVDSSLLNLPAAVLAPYPNPAVVSDMDGVPLRFKFRLPTDSTTYPAYPSAYLVVDVFSIAGERVITVEGRFIEDDRTGEHREGIYEAEWNMKNAGGKEVASGAYLAYARLFTSSARAVLLAEDRVKVALIR
jgi:hypothetical protein